MYVHNANNESSVFEKIDDKLHINSSAKCTFTNASSIKYSSFFLLQHIGIHVSAIRCGFVFDPDAKKEVMQGEGKSQG